jgi:hypothetical protein
MKGAGAALAVLALAALVIAACGRAGAGEDAPGVASVNGATTTTAAGQDGRARDPQEAALDFAKCMREHGVDMPDPEIEEGGLVRMEPGKNVRPGDPKAQAAEKACRPELGAGGDGPGPDDPQVQASMLEFAKCMRANGVENFPDPTGGGMMIGPDSGVDPRSQEFQAAQKACRSKLRLPTERPDR